jgi:putative DNA primase/helicase
MPYDVTRTTGYILREGCHDSDREMSAIAIARNCSMEGIEQHDAFDKLLKWSETKLKTPLDKTAIEDAITLGYGRASPYRNNSTLEKYHPSDLGNAQRLVDVYGDRIRYNYVFKCWYIWDGRYWRKDEKNVVEKYAKDLLIQLYSIAPNVRDEERKSFINHILKSESKQRISAMVDLSRSESGIPVIPDELDRNKQLLNVQNGTIDLNTCELLDFKKEDLITMMSNFVYDKDAKCPLWIKFIERIFGHDEELIKYGQKTLGYSLTGQASEKDMFICWGSGDTGKTTLTSTIIGLMGDYAKELPSKELFAKKIEGGSNDWARLNKVRYARSSESKKGKALDVGAVKLVTGGGRLPCRKLYQESTDMEIDFVLWLETNHKPRIPENDEAIWNRLKLIPFKVQFKKSEMIDKYWDVLIEKEASGILNWLLEGVKLWREEGIKKLPKVVSDAVDEYRTDEDILGEFINLKYDYVNRKSILLKVIYTDYKIWCNNVGYTPFSRKRLLNELKNRGHKADNKGGGNLTQVFGLAPVTVKQDEANRVKTETLHTREIHKDFTKTAFFANVASQNDTIRHVLALIKEGVTDELSLTKQLQSWRKKNTADSMAIIAWMDSEGLIMIKPGTTSEYMEVK